MKTTLDLNDALIAGAKVLAAKQHTTLTRVVEEGLRMRLQQPRQNPRSASTPAFPIVSGSGGLRPGIDPCSNKSLLEAAEGDDT